MICPRLLIRCGVAGIFCATLASVPLYAQYQTPAPAPGSVHQSASSPAVSLARVQLSAVSIAERSTSRALELEARNVAAREAMKQLQEALGPQCPVEQVPTIVEHPTISEAQRAVHESLEQAQN